MFIIATNSDISGYNKHNQEHNLGIFSISLINDNHEIIGINMLSGIYSESKTIKYYIITLLKIKYIIIDIQLSELYVQYSNL